MNAATLRALLTPAGQALLARAVALPDLRDDTVLRHLTALRRDAPAGLATAALETALLRRRAAAKFDRAAQMYFTRDALEQASASVIARYRARRFAGLDTVFDLGCGVGGDTIALAEVTARVVAVDRDPVRLAMARLNTAAYGVADRVRVVRADLGPALPLRTDGAALFVDPGRRTPEGRRVFHVEAYEPPLSVVLGWQRGATILGAKLSPGVNLSDLTALGADGEIEFISVDGDLREAALWLGPPATVARRATLLPDGHTLTGAGDRRPPVRPPGRWLLEPDPAIYRAGLLAEVAALLGAWQIDPTIAYLSADTAPATPFARAWPVEAALPFSLNGVRRWLRERRVGRVVVKKRGSPLDPAAFERMLRLEGPERRTVFLTRAAGRPVAIIAGWQG